MDLEFEMNFNRYFNISIERFQKKINECHGDQKNLFEIVNTMIGRKRNDVVLPKYDDPATLASMLNTFFIDKN